jgi:hypothetical protein
LLRPYNFAFRSYCHIEGFFIMHALLAVVAASVIGLDVGWKPLEDGGVEYIVQIHPDQVERILNSDDLLSDVPKGLDVRRYRITVGTDPLPRETGLSTAPKDESPAASEKVGVEEAASSTVVRKEVVAEGNIPVAPAAEATPENAAPELPKVELPPAAGDTKATSEPREAEDSSSEGPEFPTSLTVNKPPTTFDNRGPRPFDEEGVLPTEDDRTSRSTAPPAESDPLFSNSRNGPSSPRSELLDSRAEDRSPELTRPRGPDLSERENARGTTIRDARYEPTTRGLRDADLIERVTQRPGSNYDSTAMPNVSQNQWGPLAFIFLLLMLSLGGNFWLGWIAFEARQRYQLLLDKYRTVGGKPTVDLV